MKIAAPELLDAEVLSVLRREVLAGHHGGRPALAPAGHRGDRSERAARLNASRRDRPCCFSRPLVYAPVKPHVTARRGQRMKIYDFVGAPNPKKLRVYLAEKGIDIPCESVNIVTGENRSPGFLKKNPLGGLPVLELDDGSHLTESLAIIEYLEELHPKPPMLGTTPLERARVRELERICELGVLSAVAQIFQNTHPFMAGRFKQSADAAENARNRLAANLKVLDALIGGRSFVAGSRPSIADCTLLAALEFSEVVQLDALGARACPAPDGLPAPRHHPDQGRAAELRLHHRLLQGAERRRAACVPGGPAAAGVRGAPGSSATRRSGVRARGRDELLLRPGAA